LRGLKEISKPFYLLTNYAKIELIYRGHLGGCVLFISAKISLSTSFGKRKKRQSISAWRISTPNCTEV